MIRTSVLAAALLVAVPSTRLWASGPEMWVDADSLIARLPPSAFPRLPAPIRREIERRGCRVPQPFEAQGANVIYGQFERRGQTDWAVLCSKDGISTILIFWRGSATKVDSLAACPDRTYLQVVEPGKVGYSRRISMIGTKAMRDFYKAFGDGESPPFPLDHEAIEDYYVDKASVVHFRHVGRWVQLVGMD